MLPSDFSRFHAACDPIELYMNEQKNYFGFSHYLARSSAPNELEDQVFMLPTFGYEAEYIPLDSGSAKKQAKTALGKRMNDVARRVAPLSALLVYFFDPNTEEEITDAFFSSDEISDFFHIIEPVLVRSARCTLQDAIAVVVHNNQYNKGVLQTSHYHVVFSDISEVMPKYDSFSVRELYSGADECAQAFIPLMKAFE